MSLWRRWAHDAGGGAAVEFSAVILTLFTLMFGVTEFGWYMWTANALQQTAIQAARCMGVLSTSCASGAAYSSSNTLSYVQQVASTYGVTVPLEEPAVGPLFTVTALLAQLLDWPLDTSPARVLARLAPEVELTLLAFTMA